MLLLTKLHFTVVSQHLNVIARFLARHASREVLSSHAPSSSLRSDPIGFHRLSSSHPPHPFTSRIPSIGGNRPLTHASGDEGERSTIVVPQCCHDSRTSTTYPTSSLTVTDRHITAYRLVNPPWRTNSKGHKASSHRHSRSSKIIATVFTSTSASTILPTFPLSKVVPSQPRRQRSHSHSQTQPVSKRFGAHSRRQVESTVRATSTTIPVHTRTTQTPTARV